MSEFNYEIKSHLCTLSEGAGGWDKELTVVSYNGAEPKYDIRSWNTDENGNVKMSKGITLTKEELVNLKNFLASIDAEDIMNS